MLTSECSAACLGRMCTGGLALLLTLPLASGFHLRSGSAALGPASVGQPHNESGHVVVHAKVNDTHPTDIDHRRVYAVSSAGMLVFENGTVSMFPSCGEACRTCYDEHYQGCLAHCRVGCEDYCEEKLERPGCLEKQQWVAQVGHVLEAFDPQARLCRTTGVDGCPAMQLEPTPIPPFET
mmetsp:Transcript_61736/g.179082  ORF Transcript_61736/g.179082 Transcript_61736/m.179082 type:complete len:180 (+) Transcript_61736:92-631(+)